MHTVCAYLSLGITQRIAVLGDEVVGASPGPVVDGHCASRAGQGAWPGCPVSSMSAFILPVSFLAESPYHLTVPASYLVG
jgi:hypothetical protein